MPINKQITPKGIGRKDEKWRKNCAEEQFIDEKSLKSSKESEFETESITTPQATK